MWKNCTKYVTYKYYCFILLIYRYKDIKFVKYHFFFSLQYLILIFCCWSVVSDNFLQFISVESIDLSPAFTTYKTTVTAYSGHFLRIQSSLNTIIIWSTVLEKHQNQILHRLRLKFPSYKTWKLEIEAEIFVKLFLLV